VTETITNQSIITIGASAGGLEAIASFFDNTPIDAVSYILIQHLSPDFKSQMAQILSGHTQLKIVEVVDGIQIESNKVYLIPSSNFMSIKAGKLILSDKKEQERPYMTIDHFFISLAKERGDKAIGIVLSGTGKDGSAGIEAIKKAGGMIIVQDPETAQYSDMPLSAINTGCADFILSPKEMPQAIIDFVKNTKAEKTNPKEPEDLNENDIASIINLIKGNLPLDFTDYKKPTILRRIKRRMVQHNLGTAKKYYSFLKSDPKEIALLANDFLIGVTQFFRDTDAFNVIEKTVIPDIIQHMKADEILKVWIAGCATGEEAYSIAILIKEYITRKRLSIEVKIFATDVNKTALDFASKGVYQDKIIKSVSKTRLAEFFTKEGESYKIKHEIRKMLIFAQHDLVKNPPYCNIDMICCRNLLIYMTPVLQNRALTMMHFGLKKDGYLFLGPSENAAIIKDDFTEISYKWNIFKSKKLGRKIKFDAFSSPIMDQVKIKTAEVKKISGQSLTKATLDDQIITAILKGSGSNGICTDENMMVIKSFGDLSHYLKNEIFNFNLNDLLPSDISIIFKAAAYKALKSNEQIVLEDLRFTESTHAKNRLVDVEINPFILGKTDEKLLLILFTEKKRETTGKNIIKNADVNELTRDHLYSLEQEVVQLKHNLATAYELIESSNENMQSFNEELQSANEEMQSANEEMQSTNEELQSVNEELQTVNKENQLTNAELSESNDDLNNYFRSNKNGQLFVDHELLLKKYSSEAAKYINIRESDIGRPLSNITTNVKLDTLIDDIQKVIDTGEIITREATSLDGKIYQVMTTPYIRQNISKPDGAIISFYDITELKGLWSDLDISNKNLKTSNQSLLRINADLNNFVYTASHDLNAPILNIEGILKILKEEIDHKDPLVGDLTNMMNKAIITFKDIITDLRKIGVMEAEVQEESFSENFEDIFNEITEVISGQIKMSGATFTNHFKEKEVKFSKKYLRSILLNLVTNAIKFCPKDRKPKIFITTEMSSGFIRLTVKDNGMGIEKEQIDFIFKIYQRINANMEGQGIGLYLVKKIIDASGGKIEVESLPGTGTSFMVYFKI
jgi:two-component system CheB/CheR fusion protein